MLPPPRPMGWREHIGFLQTQAALRPQPRPPFLSPAANAGPTILRLREGNDLAAHPKQRDHRRSAAICRHACISLGASATTSADAVTLIPAAR